VANETEALVGSINDRQLLIRENVVGAIITKVRIGGELARLKEVSKEEFPDWNDWVKQEFGYSSTDSRRLILLHLRWGEWAESEAARGLLAKLPDDLAKLEWLCRLPADELEALVDSVDCHHLGSDTVRKAVQARQQVTTIIEALARCYARWEAKVEALSNEQRDKLVELIVAQANLVHDRWRADSAEEDADSDSDEGEQEEPAAARAADGEELEASDDSGDNEDDQVEDQQNGDHDDDEEPAPRPRRRGS
jgi:hypothetical protein